MITGLLLIGLGFTWVIEELRKREQLFKASQGLPVMIEAVGRAVSIETETINRNMDSITEKLTAFRARNCDHFGRICDRNVICATPKYIWSICASANNCCGATSTVLC